MVHGLKVDNNWDDVTPVQTITDYHQKHAAAALGTPHTYAGFVRLLHKPVKLKLDHKEPTVGSSLLKKFPSGSCNS